MTLAEFVNVIGFKIKPGDVEKVNATMAGIKNKATNLLGKIGIGLSIAGITTAINQCVALSSEVEEMENKFNVVFGNMREEVDAWAQDYADAIGRNKNDIKTYLADQQNLLVGFGMTREEGAKLSEEMTKLALDLASFGNLDESYAVQNMTKAVMGESEAAKGLGAVLNESTRAQAMMTLGLSGTYDSLDQLTKMQVNYQAILSQSPDAIGDCERSLNSYRSTVVAFQSKLKEIKTLIGQFFMPAEQKVVKFGGWMLTFLRNGVQRLNTFADSMGGSERILAVLAGTIALFFGYQKWGMMVSGLKSVSSLLSAVKVKTIAIFAAFLLLILLVEDFIAFMRGEDSLFGELLTRAGIDCDGFQDKVRKVLGDVKNFLNDLRENFGGTLSTLGTLLLKIAGHAGNFAVKILSLADAISKSKGASMLLGVVLSALTGIIVAFKVASMAAAAASAAETIAIKGLYAADKLAAIGKTILTGATKAWAIAAKVAGVAAKGLGMAMKFMTGPIGIAIAVILALIAAGIWLYKNWDTVKEKAIEIWYAMKDGILSIVSGLWNGITFTIGGVKDTIVSGLTAAINWIKGLPAEAYTWGADIIQGIIDGITGMIDRVGEAASGIASKIKSFIGFSVPETGPLSDFDTYMPDMIDLLVKGIYNGEGPVADAVSSLTSKISMLINTKSVSDATARGVYHSTSNRSITQNVNFKNTFHGEAAAQRHTAGVMQQASKDTTSELARGLAYAR